MCELCETAEACSNCCDGSSSSTSSDCGENKCIQTVNGPTSCCGAMCECCYVATQPQIPNENHCTTYNRLGHNHTKNITQFTDFSVNLLCQPACQLLCILECLVCSPFEKICKDSEITNDTTANVSPQAPIAQEAMQETTPILSTQKSQKTYTEEIASNAQKFSKSSFACLFQDDYRDKQSSKRFLERKVGGIQEAAAKGSCWANSLTCTVRSLTFCLFRPTGLIPVCAPANFCDPTSTTYEMK